MNRRTFIATSSLAFPAILLAGTPSRKLRVAVVGLGSRGMQHAAALAKLPDVEIAYVCDPDEKHAASAANLLLKQNHPAPKAIKDFRKALEDPQIEAVSFATPNHWHAPGALLAMSAGKHVYLEKPCSHTAREGEMLVESAHKHRRLLQDGMQRRTWPAIREAMERLHKGEIGRVLSARAYYFANRPTIGNGRATPPPAELDWSLWQGPAPEREFHDNYLHYNWHWFWHWGNGELGNNGVHMLDLCRWGLKVELPHRITYAGTKSRFPKDDQETPDQSTAAFEFKTDQGDAFVTWENRSWSGRNSADPKHDVAFFGEKGTLTITGTNATFLDLKGAETAQIKGAGGDDSHFQNFVNAIREEGTLHSTIEEAHKSTLLCHLGNIAWRTNGAVRLDTQKKRPLGKAAMKLWSREYRPGWEPKV